MVDWQFTNLNRLFISCAALCALISCVNEEHGATYDKILSGEIDKTVNVLKNVSVPIGSLEKVVVGDILEITENTELLQLDNDGNISILITGTQLVNLLFLILKEHVNVIFSFHI